MKKTKEIKLSKKTFISELEDLMMKYCTDNTEESFDIVNGLMLTLKMEACWSIRDYHSMLGILTAMLTHNLREMWEEVDERCESKKKEKQNESNTVRPLRSKLHETNTRPRSPEAMQQLPSKGRKTKPNKEG